MTKKKEKKERKFVTITNKEGLAENILKTLELGKLELLKEEEIEGKTYGLIQNQLSLISCRIPKLNYELYKKKK